MVRFRAVVLCGVTVPYFTPYFTTYGRAGTVGYGRAGTRLTSHVYFPAQFFFLHLGTMAHVQDTPRVLSCHVPGRRYRSSKNWHFY